MRKNTSKDSSPLGGIRILLAEDGLDNQRLILHVLRKAGADVKIAAKEKLAIEMLTIDGTLESPLLEPCPFDLLLSDMQMPEMDGYAATRWLRAHGCVLPIVALTAHALREELELCLEAGCNAYTTKPINKAILIDLCQKWGIESRPTVVGKS
jgi:CheY-like chemotaxis protein